MSTLTTQVNDETVEVNSEDMNVIIENYAEQCVEDMDAKTMAQFIENLISERLHEMTSQDVLTEIAQSTYSDILN